MDQISTNWIYNLASFALALIPLLAFVGKRCARSALAEKEVGTLGWLYNVNLKIPLKIWFWALILVSLWSLATLVINVYYLNTVNQPPLIDSFLGWSLYPLPVAFFLAIVAYTNLWTHLMLLITKVGDFYRFMPGWINASWQLDPPSDSYAANTNAPNCQRLAKSLFEELKKQTPKIPLEAPQPTSLDPDEMANYLLIRGALESHINKLYGNALTLHNMQEYLYLAAQTQGRPFKPIEIMSHAKNKRSFYETLRSLSNSQKKLRVDCLPPDPPIFDSVNKIVNQLARQHKGKGSDLAMPRFGWQPSARTLLRRLRKFDIYGMSEGQRRLFLKLSLRWRIWPSMDPGPFLFPYNNGIALLLLNSGCIIVPAKLSRLLIDNRLCDLVAYTEDKVIKESYEIFKLTSRDSATINFSQSVFGCDPNNVSMWDFVDRVDLLLFSHAKRFCLPMSKDTPLEGSCLLISRNGVCFCEGTSVRWLVQEFALVKRLQ